jgi:aminoglycoside phosphotransferase (APT) family kinase protein
MTDLFTADEIEALDAWLADNVPALGDGVLETGFVAGGTTNVIVRLSRGGRELILRKSPKLAPPASAKSIQREATVLKGLGGSRVPHPGFHAYCDDPAVVGGPFYVMDLVDGWAADLHPVTNKMSFRENFQGGDLSNLAYAMMDGIIEMANLDYVAAGLEGFGKPDKFLERQVDRWGSQLASYPTRYPGYEVRDLPGLTYVADWLRANIPTTGKVGLMHGDYGMSNVLFANQPPSRLAAIIDWETATIGDPMMDVAGYVSQLRRVNGQGQERSYLPDPSLFPTFEEALAYFGERTGRDVSCIDYYLILAKYRMACIIEYKVAEATVGISSPEKGARFDGLVRGLLTEAETLARAAG